MTDFYHHLLSPASTSSTHYDLGVEAFRDASAPPVSLHCCTLDESVLVEGYQCWTSRDLEKSACILAGDDVVVLKDSRHSIVIAHIRPPSSENTMILIDKIARGIDTSLYWLPLFVLACDLNTRTDKADDPRPCTLDVLCSVFSELPIPRRQHENVWGLCSKIGNRHIRIQFECQKSSIYWTKQSARQNKRLKIACAG